MVQQHAARPLMDWFSRSGLFDGLLHRLHRGVVIRRLAEPSWPAPLRHTVLTSAKSR